MRTTQIRQQLHDYIDAAEDKKLKAIYTLVENDIAQESLMTDAQFAEVERRYADHEAGIGRTYTWEETVELAERTLAERKKNR